MAKKQSKKKNKAEQLKIANTGRPDAIQEIEDASEEYRDKRDERMDLQEEENAAQERVTELLKKHGLAEYKYEGKDGKPYRAYVDKPRAKVQRIKQPTAKKQASPE